MDIIFLKELFFFITKNNPAAKINTTAIVDVMIIKVFLFIIFKHSLRSLAFTQFNL